MKAILLIGMLAVAAYANTPVIKSCDGYDGSTYQVDLSNTFTTPKDVEKGNHVNLAVNGVMTDDVQLNMLELDVYWAGTFLQNVTAKETDSVSAGSPYTLNFGVDIPGFAPGGAYSLTAYVKGSAASSGSQITNLACLDVTFSL